MKLIAASNDKNEIAALIIFLLCMSVAYALAWENIDNTRLRSKRTDARCTHRSGLLSTVRNFSAVSLAGFSIFTHDRRINLVRSGSNRLPRKPCVALLRGIRWLKSDRRRGDHASLVGALNSNFPFYLLVIVVAATSPVTYASYTHTYIHTYTHRCLSPAFVLQAARLRVELSERGDRAGHYAARWLIR